MFSVGIAFAEQLEQLHFLYMYECEIFAYIHFWCLLQIGVIDGALKESANQMPSWHSIVPRKEIKVSTVDEFQVSKFLVI